MVIGPSDVTKQDYDLLIVDEAQLKEVKNITRGFQSNQLKIEQEW